jgi:AcrR family transcriptional regulator
MKAYQSKHTKTNPQNHNKRNDHEGPDDTLDQIAEELTEMAQRRLPDGALQGILRGCEEDIRQEAILLALTWYLRGASENRDKPVEAWHAPRAIAGALRIIKRDTIKDLLDETEKRHRIDPMTTTICHPVMVRACDWPTPVMRNLCHQAIRIALRDRRISPLNAAVAEAVYVNGIQVIDLAARRNVHRSSIYQHLSRVQRHLRDVIESMEVTLMELM